MAAPSPMRTIIKLVILSLVVGMVLSFFGITPLGFWQGAGEFAEWLWNWAVGFFEWALIFIIIGAAVVVPIYIVKYLLKGRRKTRD